MVFHLGQFDSGGLCLEARRSRFDKRNEVCGFRSKREETLRHILLSGFVCRTQETLDRKNQVKIKTLGGFNNRHREERSKDNILILLYIII